MGLKLVIFDVDGTLVDSQGHIQSAMRGTFAAFGLPEPPPEATRGVIGLSLEVAIGRLAGADAPVAEMTGRYKEIFSAGRSGVAVADLSPLFPGAEEVLKWLRDRPDTLLGIATGKSRRGLSTVLKAHGIEECFATMRTADDHPSKPHPSMVTAAMDETGCDPADTVLVGDTTYDIDMARAAGVRAVGVGWGYHPPAALTEAGAVGVPPSFAALPPVLERIWSGAS